MLSKSLNYIFEEFKDKFNEKKETMLNYYLRPNGEELKKFEELEFFESYKFNNPIKQIWRLHRKKWNWYFLYNFTNIFATNLDLKNFVINHDEY